MFLQPKKVKFRKQIKGRIAKKTSKDCLKFGSFGLQSLTSFRLTRYQIEACRRILSRRLKKIAKIWVRVFPNIPVTEKPRETRIGKGKGGVSFWIARVSSGTVLFEIQETWLINRQPKLTPLEAKLTLKEVAKKLPCNRRIIKL